MREQILELMEDIVKKEEIELTLDSISENVMDSITFIKVIVELESKFDFEFGDEMLVISKFPVIEDLIAYIESIIVSKDNETSLNDNQNGG